MKGVKEDEIVECHITGRTYNRLMAIARNNTQEIPSDMDSLINIALSWQRREYERVKSELNHMMKKGIGGW